MCPLLLLIVAQVNKPQTQISLLLFPWSHLQSKLNTRVYLLHILVGFEHFAVSVLKYGDFLFDFYMDFVYVEDVY